MMNFCPLVAGQEVRPAPAAITDCKDFHRCLHFAEQRYLAKVVRGLTIRPQPTKSKGAGAVNLIRRNRPKPGLLSYGSPFAEGCGATGGRTRDEQGR
jgi:hypothetical protein